MRAARTYRQVSQETGIPLDTLGSGLDSMGFARRAPDELVREDELEIVPLLLAESASPTGVSFVEVGRLRFKGIARPVRVLEARSA